jgi:GT2 family glycosyltransferase
VTATLPRLAIVIVNWNGRDDTLECLASLADDPYVSRRIFVVDNGSTDDSTDQIAARYPDARLLCTGANLGFTGGNRVGIAAALADGADYLLLLNNDTTVEPGLSSLLVTAAESEPGVGIWSPMVFHFDQRQVPWFSGSRMDLKRGVAVHDNNDLPDPSAGPISVPWVSGCAMFLSTDLVRQLGGFDDRFFLNWEDVDLSLRAASAGVGLRLLPAARVYHKVGRSFERASTDGLYYSVRNNLLLLRKHLPGRWNRIIAGCRVTGRALRQVVGDARRGRPWTAPLRAVCAAVSDHLFGRYGPRGGAK